MVKYYYVTAVDVVAKFEGISNQEAKRLLKSGAVSIAENENSPLRKVNINEIFRIDKENHE